MDVGTIPSAASTATLGLGGPPHGAAVSSNAESAGGAHTTEADATRRLVGDTSPDRVPDFKRYAVSFRIEEESKRIVVQIIDVETKQVVRSVPPEDVIQALKRASAVSGALIDAEI